MIETDILFLLLILFFVAGFIDSIAGGGGLITIPTFALVIGLNAETIGTNKIAGSIAAGVAFLVYLKKGFFKWKEGLLFTIFIGIGSFLGSQAAPYVPAHYFKYFLIITAPLVLWILFNKNFWIQKVDGLDFKKSNLMITLAGILCGFYDGIWGPGGGTFMLLSLLVLGNLNLMAAIAISKFSNLISAMSSLSGYALKDSVDWKLGAIAILPITFGALLGAQLASKKAEKIVKPILVVVVLLLMFKVIFDEYQSNFTN